MKILKWSVAAAIFAGIIFCFSTCHTMESKGQVEISLFTWPAKSTIDIAKKRIALFEKENPDIKVRLILGYEDKYLTMITGGVAPDVGLEGEKEIPFYAKRKAILPLDEFVKKDKDFSLDRFFPIALESMKYKGKLYGLPEEGSPVALIYNKDIFDRWNKAHPDQHLDYPNENWTWADFRRAAKLLTQDTDGDGKTDVFGTLISFSKNRFPIQVWQNGGEIISKDKKRCMLTEPAAVEAIQWLYDIIWKDHSAPTAFTAIEGVGTVSEGRFFVEERVAIMMQTRYAYSNLIGKTHFEWDIAPLPRGKVSNVSLYIGGGWLMSAQTHHPEECWRLMKFITNERCAEILLERGRAISANKIATIKFLTAPGHLPKHDYYWIDIMHNSRVKDFEFRGMWGFFSQARDQIGYLSTGRLTPKEACENFCRIFNEGLKLLWEEGGP